MPFRLLIVDDEIEFASSLSRLLASNGFPNEYVTSPAEVETIVKSQRIDLVLMDMRMPGLGGIDLLRRIRELQPHVQVIMMTGYPSVENVVLAMKYGALNFFVKPIKIGPLVEEIRLIAESSSRRAGGGEAEKAQLVTLDPAMLDILNKIQKSAPTNAPVLILGESGTGKELIANLIHAQSKRAESPCVKVNCAAIPDALLESELFGHERGAFTDAVTTRIGKFEYAHGGSVFLDEIGDMSIGTQAKILRFLQEKEFQRVGTNTTMRADVRIIAATNKDIAALAEDGSFRQDLYYRLSVITLRLPPLRERRIDIPLLADHFLELFNTLYGKDIRHISEEVRLHFLCHGWPGNIRELRNCMERAVIFCEGDTLTSRDFSSQYENWCTKDSGSGLEEIYSSLSREVITDALKKCNGNKQKASEYLKISRKTLYNRMKKLDL
jgi:two-component system, NtrC family, response regulator AtoC